MFKTIFIDQQKMNKNLTKNKNSILKKKEKLKCNVKAKSQI